MLLWHTEWGGGVTVKWYKHAISVVTVQRKFCKQSAKCKRPPQHTISYLVEQLEEMGKLLNQQNVMVRCPPTCMPHVTEEATENG